MIDFDEQEWAFRQRRYEQLRDSIDDLDDLRAVTRTAREEGRPELDAALETFRETQNARTLREFLDTWSRGNRHYGFAGPNGAMFLNQLVNDSDPEEIDALLTAVVPPPEDEAEARSKFEQLIDHVERLRTQGSAAAVGRVGGLLSWFWWVQDADQWPMQFSSGMKLLDTLGFLVDATEGPWSRYADYRRHVHRFGPFAEAERVFVEHADGNLGVDPSAGERCARVPKLAHRQTEDDGTYDLNRASVGVLRAMAKHISKRLAPAVGDILGVQVGSDVPTEYWDAQAKRLREDIWASWRPTREGAQPFLQLLVAADGVKIGLFASHQQTGGKGYPKRVAELLEGHEPEGYEWIPWGTSSGYTLLGRQFDIADLVDPGDLDQAVQATAQDLKPCFERLWREDSPELPSPADHPDPDDAGALPALRQEFIENTGYPTDTDTQHIASRREFADLLASNKLASIAEADLRRIYGGKGYGYPGLQATLHRTLNQGGQTVYDRFLRAVDYLLWDNVDDVAMRIDRIMDEDDLGMPGFKEGAILKLLSVAHPERILPIFPYTGQNGKAALLQTVDADGPPLSASVGTRHVAANDALRAITEPLFPDDPWGQKNFLYWLQQREAETGATIQDVEPTSTDRIGDAAENLHLPRGFLEDIHALLDKHRQVIFYGPPGTGKTYVAQHLAEAIAPEEEQRLLVQFHPSTSYEDFFEGFRPSESGDGGISYVLVNGPLRNMASRAAEDPLKRPHILIIDEINRANLAKVLGELLFLLEYRDAEIRPLYRPEEPFGLPENLWIIGTMNTADRSIATVDAALRRRFHFVPFVPDDREDNPISGLLRRWLEDNDGPEWLADLVDGVNQRLRKEMGGDHLLLGPSYFMEAKLDEAGLQMIWRYQIEPLVDDLFFGSDKAKSFHFADVWETYGPPATEEE